MVKNVAFSLRNAVTMHADVAETRTPEATEKNMNQAGVLTSSRWPTSKVLRPLLMPLLLLLLVAANLPRTVSADDDDDADQIWRIVVDFGQDVKKVCWEAAVLAAVSALRRSTRSSSKMANATVDVTFIDDGLCNEFQALRNVFEGFTSALYAATDVENEDDVLPNWEALPPLVVAGSCDDACHGLALYGAVFDVPVVTFGCTTDIIDPKLFPGVTSALPLVNAYSEPIIAFLKHYATWKHVYILYDNDDKWLSCGDLMYRTMTNDAYFDYDDDETHETNSSVWISYVNMTSETSGELSACATKAIDGLFNNQTGIRYNARGIRSTRSVSSCSFFSDTEIV